MTNVAAAANSSDAEETERFARERLGQARQRSEAARAHCRAPSFSGPPAEAIVRLARDRNADLIVVGTRRKGFFDRLIEGSVNLEVLRHATRDVLVVY